MKEDIKARLEALRLAMVNAGVYATIVPQTDPHQSEYLAAHWQVRRFLSGFTGSAGSLVVTPDKALLWTDSRYFIQAEEQLQDTEIILMKEGLSSTPSINSWLCTNVPTTATVGVDGMLFTHSAIESMKSQFNRFSISLTTDFSPIDSIWNDRPALPKCEAFAHDIKYAGESAADKIANLLKQTEATGATDLLITPLDEIAWTLNIRSKDVPCNPVATSYLYLSPLGNTLFIDSDKITPSLKQHLNEAGVKTMGYNEIIPFIEALPPTKVLANPDRTAERIWNALADNAVAGITPVALTKACKNEVQINGTRQAMVRDGVALVKSVMEIEQRLKENKTLTEIDVADILLKYRSQQELFFDISFDTIAGYSPHGAIVHYSATKESNSTILPKGLLLIDSGGQYLDGTTDITRTIALGEPTPQEKSDFTLVMKGHIALGTAIFPDDTRGAQLDALARQFLWKHGLSYLHGTGHGVGHFLNVHEGPHSIRLNNVPVNLALGMITSNEPGVYRAGIHGIRCENLVLTVPAFTTEFGNFLKFETLTLFPFDRNLFDLNLMTDDEIAWINDYHTTVYSRLSPMLDNNEQEWLREKTLQLSR